MLWIRTNLLIILFLTLFFIIFITLNLRIIYTSTFTQSHLLWFIKSIIQLHLFCVHFLLGIVINDMVIWFT